MKILIDKQIDEAQEKNKELRLLVNHLITYGIFYHNAEVKILEVSK